VAFKNICFVSWVIFRALSVLIGSMCLLALWLRVSKSLEDCSLFQLSRIADAYLNCVFLSGC